MTQDCILIAGLGSIGKRHLRNLKVLRPNMKIVVLRRSASLLAEEEILADEIVTNVEDAISHTPIAAIISNPAPFHVPLAIELAKNNIHLFIEKPLSNKVDGIQGLINICKVNALTLHTAYPFRFYPLIIELKQAIESQIAGTSISVLAECGQYLPDWRVGQDYRNGVSANSDLGGGVLLEISHEFDYLRYLFGEPKSLIAHCLNSGILDIDVEDLSDVLINFESGVQANVHLDCLQRVPSRKCKVICSEGTLQLDFLLNKLELFTSENIEPKILYEDAGYDKNSMFIDELEYFLSIVHNGTQSKVNGFDGLQVVKMVEAAKISSELRKEIIINDQ